MRARSVLPFFAVLLVASVSFGNEEAQAPTPTPAASPEATATPAATPSATATPTPAPTATPTPKATPKPTPEANLDKLELELRRQCERHFAGIIQGELRSACSSAASEFQRIGKALAQTRCRLDYGEEPRLVMACIVGSSITDDIVNKREDFKSKLQLCAEHYPVHNEIDAALQESCITGAHLPELVTVDPKARYAACAQVSPERSFIGPCSVGLSLVLDNKLPIAPGHQNQLCKQYFDFKRFHAGYRACLLARGLAPEIPAKSSEAIKSCSNIVADPENETERAACFVGVTIFRHLNRQDEVEKRFKKCGTNQVRYSDRDFLACLAAGSLLDFNEGRGGAEAGCREIYRNTKLKGRADCMSALSQF
jgi:hypothetical protein